MKIVHWGVGILAGILGIIAILMTSFEIGMYGDFDFYEKEYAKFEVTADLEMEMADVMAVTHEMMDYLRGDRENLMVMTTVAGVEQDFFNEQDRLHMADVQKLFIGGLRIRTGCVAGMVLCILLLLILKADWKRILPRAYQISLAIAMIFTGIVAFAFSRDFTAAFTKFHELFFTNDLWIFDPAEDLMIRMLPEGFFADMVIRIGGLFVGVLVLLLVISIICSYRTSKLDRQRNKEE